VYLPRHALRERERRIRALGARTVHVDGDYDEAVACVQEDARRNRWIVVSDTSEVAGDTSNLRVMAGYALIVEEALEQMDAPPTHVFLQAGVGTLAAGVIAQLARRLGVEAPRCVVVEPESAACVLRALSLGAPSPLDGPLDSAMDCLAAGRVSATAWPLLEGWIDAALAIDDAAARAAVSSLRAGDFGEVVTTAPSGAAGLAGLFALAANDDARGPLVLSDAARVLVIGTEEALPGA
jgi:diaminopropionate ammonia-lyase